MSALKNNTDTQNTTKALAVSKAPKSAVSSLSLGSADDALTLAKELQKFVKDNKLTSNIQGKEFPNVEAWQFAGSLLGLSPLLESIEDKSTQAEIKWNATVAVQNLHTGAVVGRGFATCSNKESSKKFFADYAICSMAQTRAVGKAYRLALGWLMKAAGYEATPFEEMSEVGTGASIVAETPKKPAAEASAPASAPPAASAGAAPKTGAERQDEILAETRVKLLAARSKLELKELWNSLTASLRGELQDEFSAARLRVEAAIAHAAATVVREQPAAMKDAGNDSALVDEFEAKPVFGPGPAVEYATSEQTQCIQRLLNHPLITRKEKTKLLLVINKLDKERARQAITKLRDAIGQREGIDPRDAVRASIKSFVLRNAPALTTQQAEELNSLAADSAATLDFLTEALELAQNALIDEETYGTDAELAEAENAIAA